MPGQEKFPPGQLEEEKEEEEEEEGDKSGLAGNSR